MPSAREPYLAYVQEDSRSPFKPFDPKSVTRASWEPEPKKPKPKPNGPLLSFNRHPEYVAFANLTNLVRNSRELTFDAFLHLKCPRDRILPKCQLQDYESPDKAVDRLDSLVPARLEAHPAYCIARRAGHNDSPHPRRFSDCVASQDCSKSLEPKTGLAWSNTLMRPSLALLRFTAPMVSIISHAQLVAVPRPLHLRITSLPPHAICASCLSMRTARLPQRTREGNGHFSLETRTQSTLSFRHYITLWLGIAPSMP